MQSLFDELGIIRVYSPELLLETLKFTATSGIPTGRKLAAFTCSGGEALMIGTLLSAAPSTDADGKGFAVSAYSRAGVLGDCTMPNTSYPLQFKNASLAVIAERLCAPFSIPVRVIGDMGAPFKRVRLTSVCRCRRKSTSI